MFNKKGDLALSTNAIVVLIIAVIMLGLIIGFVTRGFASVEAKFFGEIEKLPDPVTPSATRPVTSSEVLVGSPGDDFGLKIAVFNPTDQPLPSLSPSITCQGAVLEADTSQVNPATIEPRSFKVFTFVSKVDESATPGKKLCQIVAGAYTGDLIIEVKD